MKNDVLSLHVFSKKIRYLDKINNQELPEIADEEAKFEEIKLVALDEGGDILIYEQSGDKPGFLT